jgi:phosphoesterase RecJ-like protein
MNYRDAYELLKASKKILFITHTSPDGDALGSMLGMGIALNQKGKNISFVCMDKIPQPFLFLPHSSNISNNFLSEDVDTICIMDCGDMRRTGLTEQLKKFSKKNKKIINFDHHPKNDLHKIATINLVDYQASSTSEIVFNFIKESKLPIDKEIALCLLCGLYTDTGSFKHSNTTTKTLQIASILLRRGARLKKITENVINNHSVSSLKLWGIALSRLQFNKKYNIASSAINLDDIKSCDATNSDVSGIVNMINTIPGVKIALFLHENNDKIIKGSLRTDDETVNLSKFAKLFGGGGLKKASGFTIKGQIDIDKNKFCIKYIQ